MGLHILDVPSVLNRTIVPIFFVNSFRGNLRWHPIVFLRGGDIWSHTLGFQNKISKYHITELVSNTKKMEVNVIVLFSVIPLYEIRRQPTALETSAMLGMSILLNRSHSSTFTHRYHEFCDFWYKGLRLSPTLITESLLTEIAGFKVPTLKGKVQKNLYWKTWTSVLLPESN